MSLPQLLNEQQAAAALNVSVRTLQAWRLRGQGPKYMKLGRSVRYSATELDEWLACRVMRNTADTAARA